MVFVSKDFLQTIKIIKRVQWTTDAELRALLLDPKFETARSDALTRYWQKKKADSDWEWAELCPQSTHIRTPSKDTPMDQMKKLVNDCKFVSQFGAPEGVGIRIIACVGSALEDDCVGLRNQVGEDLIRIGLRCTKMLRVERLVGPVIVANETPGKLLSRHQLSLLRQTFTPLIAGDIESDDCLDELDAACDEFLKSFAPDADDADALARKRAPERDGAEEPPAKASK
jgi:hypothetical protein